MWFGFGQTAARNFAKMDSALEYSPLLKEWKETLGGLLKQTSVEQCPAEWWVNNTANGVSIFDTNSGTANDSPSDAT